jgi:hypothetical protein
VKLKTGTLLLVKLKTGTLLLVKTGTLLLAQFHTLEPIVSTVRHVTGNDKDYLRKIPRVVW